MIGLLLSVLILALVAFVAFWIIQQLPFPPPIKNIAMAIVGLIILLVLIGMLFGGVPYPYMHGPLLR